MKVTNSDYTPNPAINYLNVEGADQIKLIEMYDVLGNLLVTFGKNDIINSRINIDGYAPTGTYLFKMETKLGVIKYHKILILKK